MILMLDRRECNGRYCSHFVVAQLNKLKFAKMTGSMPEKVNFGIKASTVKS